MRPFFVSFEWVLLIGFITVEPVRGFSIDKMTIKKWNAFVDKSPGNSTWIFNIAVRRCNSLTSSASNCPLFPPLFSLCGIYFSTYGMKPQSRLWWSAPPVSSREIKEQIRMVNMQQQEQFHSVSCPLVSADLSPSHFTLISSLSYSSAHARTLLLLYTQGAGSSTICPSQRLIIAPPVVCLYPSSSPSLAQYTDHQPILSPFPRII